MKKAYMVCDYADDKAKEINDTPHVGIEYLGDCRGRIVSETGEHLGHHHSSTFGWLRHDLRRNVDPNEYEVIDLIGKEIPNELAAILAPESETGAP